MKRTNVMYLPRTKTLDAIISSLQRRMNQFKESHNGDLFKEDFETDYFIAGKTWKRKQDEGDNIVFDAGSYSVDPKISSVGSAHFEVHYDNLQRKIAAMYILLDA